MGAFFLHSFVPSWRNCLTSSSFHHLGRAADHFSGEPLWYRAAGQGGRKHSGDNWFVLPCNFHIHYLCLSICASEVLSISISLYCQTLLYDRTLGTPNNTEPFLYSPTAGQAMPTLGDLQNQILLLSKKFKPGVCIYSSSMSDYITHTNLFSFL